MAAWARTRLDRAGDRLRPMHVVALLDCSFQAGSAADGTRVSEHVRHPSARVRLAALEVRPRLLDHDDAGRAAQEALLGSSPRVAAAAARALVRCGARAEVAATAWESERPWSRRAAWRVSRAASSSPYWRSGAVLACGGGSVAAPLSEGERRHVVFCAGLPTTKPTPAVDEHRGRGRLAWHRHRGRPRRSEP